MTRTYASPSSPDTYKDAEILAGRENVPEEPHTPTNDPDRTSDTATAKNPPSPSPLARSLQDQSLPRNQSSTKDNSDSDSDKDILELNEVPPNNALGLNRKNPSNRTEITPVSARTPNHIQCTA